MKAADLLEEARNRGVQVEVNADLQLRIVGPPSARQVMRPALRRHKVEILQELLAGSCARCGTSKAEAGRLVVSYYGPSFCPPCCGILAQENDRDDSWPPVPWEDSESFAEG